MNRISHCKGTERAVRSPLRVVLAAGALVALATPATAQAPDLAMLDTLAKGSWELRLRNAGAPRTVCLRTGRELIQIQHSQGGCSHYVVEDSPGSVTVQYTCRGDGYGRTTIRREGAGLVQVRSQGTQGGMPFSIEGEARRTGTC